MTNWLIISHLNTNSLRNKFEMLPEIVKDKLDILLISETNVHLSFPSSLITTKGFSSPFRLGRNSQQVELPVYFREEIPSKFLCEYKPNNSVENLTIPINLTLQAPTPKNRPTLKQLVNF